MTRYSQAMRTLDDRPESHRKIFDLLPLDSYCEPGAIFSRYRLGSIYTVRNILRALANDGLIDRAPVPRPEGGHRWVYRKLTALDAPPAAANAPAAAGADTPIEARERQAVADR